MNSKELKLEKLEDKILIKKFEKLPIELVYKIIMFRPRHPLSELLNNSISYYKEYCDYRKLNFGGKGVGVSSYKKFMFYVYGDIYFDYFNLPNE